MINLAEFYEVIILLGFPVLAFGCVALFGKKLKYTLAIVALSQCVQIGLTGFLLSEIEKEHVLVKTQFTNWFMISDQNIKFEVGTIIDTMGLTSVLVIALLLLILSVSQWFKLDSFPTQNKWRNYYCGMSIAQAGVNLAWLSSGYWVYLLGLFSVYIGILICGSAKWVESKDHSDDWMRSGVIGSFGIIISIIGALILLGQSASLNWHHLTYWERGWDIYVGTTLMLLGAYLTLQPYPFSSHKKTGFTYSLAEDLLVQCLIVAWAVFPLFVRFVTRFDFIGVNPSLGILFSIVSILTLISGIVEDSPEQKIWRLSFSLVSTSFAVSCLAGVQYGYSILVGSTIGLLAIAALTVSHKSKQKIIKRKGVDWFRSIVLGLSVMQVMGLVSTVSSNGFVSVFHALFTSPIHLVFVASNYFLIILLAGVVFWDQIKRISKDPFVFNSCITSLCLILVFGMGFVWTGSISGGSLWWVFEENTWIAVDRIWDSWLAKMFLNYDRLTYHERFFSYDGQSWLYLSSVYLGCIALGLSLSVWLNTKLEIIHVSKNKIKNYLIEGFYVIRLFAKITTIISSQLSRFETNIIEKKIIRNIFLKTDHFLQWSVRLLIRGDQATFREVTEIVRKSATLSSKSFQIISNGNFQWYILFGLGSLMVLLLHFFLVLR